MQHYILDTERRVIPTDLLSWGRWAGAARTSEIARTEVSHLLVLTSFAGIDVNFGEGTPAYFETRVLDGIDELDGIVTSSWDDALIEHQTLVSRWGGWADAASNAAERTLAGR